MVCGVIPDEVSNDIQEQFYIKDYLKTMITNRLMIYNFIEKDDSKSSCIIYLVEVFL